MKLYPPKQLFQNLFQVFSRPGEVREAVRWMDEEAHQRPLALLNGDLSLDASKWPRGSEPDDHLLAAGFRYIDRTWAEDVSDWRLDLGRPPSVAELAAALRACAPYHDALCDGHPHGNGAKKLEINVVEAAFQQHAERLLEEDFPDELDTLAMASWCYEEARRGHPFSTFRIVTEGAAPTRFSLTTRHSIPELLQGDHRQRGCNILTVVKDEEFPTTISAVSVALSR